MNWYYSLNGQQTGPVSELDLSGLFSRGTVTAATLVWREGMPDWQPVSAALPNLVAAPDAPQLGGLAVPAADKDLLVQQMREGVASTAPGVLNYAGFWIRVVAKIIDIVILEVVQIVLSVVARLAVAAIAGSGGNANELQLGMSLVLILVSIGIGLTYQMLMLGKYGATLGKMAVGLKVVRADGSPISMGLAAGRFFAEWLSGMILCVGYIMVAFDSEKRALHDQICGTRVIKVR